MTEMTSKDDRPSRDDDDAFSVWLKRKREERKASSELEVRQRREADFPEVLQGRWVDAEDSETALVIQGNQLIWAGELRLYLDKMLLVLEEDEIYYDVVFPEDDDEDSQTSLLLMGDELFFQNWHSVAGFVKEES